eukprot:6458385-Amphidinium_carterae.1
MADLIKQPPSLTLLFQCSRAMAETSASPVEVPEGWLTLMREGEIRRQRYPEEAIECIEVFGGCGRLSEAMVDTGMSVWKYELTDSNAEDILTEQVSIAKHGFKAIF